jgi:hypothetical protein
MSAWGAVASVAGDILGGVSSAWAQRNANRSLMKYEAETDRDLRRSAYQDTMYDMSEAGLNPILAYKNGATGGSTSVGSQSVSSPNLSNLGTNAVDAYKRSKDAEFQDQMIKKTIEETELTKANKEIVKNALKVDNASLNERINSAVQEYETKYSESYNSYLQSLVKQKVLNSGMDAVNDLENVPSNLSKGIKAFGKTYFNLDLLIRDAQKYYEQIKSNYNKTNWKGN